MTTNFQVSQKEVKSMMAQANQLVQGADSNQPLVKNLEALLEEQLPGSSVVANREVAEGLLKGVTSFTEAYRSFCEEGEMNLYDRCLKEIEDRPAQEQAACLLNFTALIKTLDSAVLKEVLEGEGANLLDRFDEFRGAEVTDEVSQEQLSELRGQLRTALEQNAVCMAGGKEMKNLLKGLDTDTEAVKLLADKKLKEVDYTCYVALAAYLANKRGELSEVTEEVDPEVLAVGVAAGVERAKVMARYGAGLITWEKACKLLEFIGGAVLIGLFAFVNVGVGLLIAGGVTILFGGLMNSMTLGVLAGLLLGGVVACTTIPWLLEKVEEPLMETLAEGYEKLTELIREKAPVLLEHLVSFWAYLKDKAVQFLAYMKKQFSKNEDGLVIQEAR